VLCLRGLEALPIQRVETAVDGLEEVDGMVGDFDRGILAERELVELANAVPVVLAQYVEVFEELDRVQAAGDEVVVPACR
jgi:small ligand-binding sensory domain FIST